MESVKIKANDLIALLQRLELRLNEQLSKVLFGSKVSEFTDIPLPSEVKRTEDLPTKKSKRKKKGFWSGLKAGQQLKLFFKRSALQLIYSLENVWSKSQTRSRNMVVENHYRS